MSDQFEKDIITNINAFRKNPKSVQHQIEVLQKGISRLKSDDPFLAEINSFIKIIPSIPSMQQVVIDKALCDIASSELKKYVKNEKNYNPYMIGNELKGIVSDEILGQNPGLIADNGADEAETVVPKLLLNRLDKGKKGRKIMLNQEYNLIGVARTRHDDENYYVIIFANGDIKLKLDGEVELSVKEKEYKGNYQYYESKFITNKRKQAVIQHKRHGEIGGAIKVKNSDDAQIYENKTTLTIKEAQNMENVNNSFFMISPKKPGFRTKFNFDIKNTNERRTVNVNKPELKTIKIELKKDRAKVEEKKAVVKKVEKKKEEPEKKITKIEKVEKIEKIEKVEKKENGDNAGNKEVKSIRRRFFRGKK